MSSKLKLLKNFTDFLDDVIEDSQPLSISSDGWEPQCVDIKENPKPEDSLQNNAAQPAKGTGQHDGFRSVEEIDSKYREVFTHRYFNLVQTSVIEDALYSDKSLVVCAPTGSGKTVIFEMAIVQLLMEIENNNSIEDYKIIYIAPVKALCTERLSEWYPKFMRLGLMCIEVTGDTDVDFPQLKPYRIIITTPEKWDMLTRRWRDHRSLVGVIKLILIDEVHILNDATRGPVLEAVVSRMKTIESAAQLAHRIEQVNNIKQGTEVKNISAPPKIRFVAISATVSNPEDVASWLGTNSSPAVFHKFGDECRPVQIKRIVEGYPCPDGMSAFKFDFNLNYKLWPIIQKYHNGNSTLIFCNTRKSVTLTAETLSKEITVNFDPQQKAKLIELASSIKDKKIKTLLINGVGFHHAGLLFEDRTNIEHAFKNRVLPILITTTTLALGVNLPAHLVIIKNTKQYVNGAYQEYSISTVLQMVGRAGRPQYDTEATAVIMTTLKDKPRYQALVEGSEPLQSYLHKRFAENLNSEVALGTVGDVAQCEQWLRSTFFYVRARRDPSRYLGLPPEAPQHLISQKITELCMRAMNGLESSGMITKNQACCIQSTEAGRLMSLYYLDLDTMKHIMTIRGSETLEQLLWIVCECHELADMYLRTDERRLLNTLNRNNAAETIRFPMKGKITTRQMKLNCIIQAVLGCLPIPDSSLIQEAIKIMRIADKICKCLVAYVTRSDLVSLQPKFYSATLNSLVLAKCVTAQLWENSPYVSKQLKGIGATFSKLLATAGKVNFMLLEESHPRDLERILNKGPPFGNELHKLLTLLPKYQLTITPIDHNHVSVQLLLLNQAYLSQNLDQLTAGHAHKCYIVIGDSENNLHKLTSFKDKDLINAHDGSITYQITRKHSFEHKVFVHCISASFVGIDARCEHLFVSLEPTSFCTNKSSTTTKQEIKRQTTITDTFRQRKRKNIDNITQSNEKKKRNNDITEKFQSLNEYFNIKQLKDKSQKTVEMSDEILDANKKPNQEVTSMYDNEDSFENYLQKTLSETTSLHVDTEEISRHENILQKIENEINSSKENASYQNTENTIMTCESNSNNLKIFTNTNTNFTPSHGERLRKSIRKSNIKTNYNFIDLLERNIDLNEDVDNDNLMNNTGFSDTIKNQIGVFLKNTYSYTKPTNTMIEELVNEPQKTELPSVCLKRNPKGGKDTINENKSKKTIIIQEINDPDETENQNNKEYLSEEIGTKGHSDITLYNSLCKVSESNLNVKRKEDDIGKSVINASNIDNSELLAPLMKTCSLKGITTEFESYFNYEYNNFNNTEIKPIEDKIHIPNSDNTLELYYSDNTNIQNNEVLHSGSQRNLQLINRKTVVTSLEDSINKDTIIPPKEPEISLPDIHKIKFPSTSLTPIMSGTENQDIRKYSYSLTNINYSSKNMQGHFVRVTRKLKLDLGITEIISRNMNEDIKTNEVITGIPKTFTKINKEHGVDTYVNVMNDVPNYIEDKKCVVHNKLNEDTSLKIKDKEEVENQTKIYESEKNISEHNCSDEKNVTQILQKYSKIFRKKTEPVNRIQTSVKINNSDKPGSTKIVKPIRPFKINQINNIHVPLPNTLIENINSDGKVEQTPEIVGRNQILPDNINKTPILLSPTEMSENKAPECEFHINSYPEFTEDFQIDESMFDPKALLLRTLKIKTDNDHIIPPPPEFSDSVDSGTSHRRFFEDFETIELPDNTEETHNSLQMDRQESHVTPSGERETWTISRNSTWTNEQSMNRTSYDRSIPFPQNKYSSGNTLVTSVPSIIRRQKLRQFSYRRKEMKKQ